MLVVQAPVAAGVPRARNHRDLSDENRSVGAWITSWVMSLVKIGSVQPTYAAIAHSEDFEFFLLATYTFGHFLLFSGPEISETGNGLFLTYFPHP